jgi:RND superfamily putative drug exporter
MNTNINLAARMGRWSASHWKTAVFGWLAFVAAALVVGQMVGTKTLAMNDMATGQARQADQLLSRAGLQSDPQTEIVLIQSRTHTAGDNVFRAVVADVAGTVRPFPMIQHLRTPYQPGRADQISRDGHSAMVEWEMKGDSKV